MDRTQQQLNAPNETQRETFYEKYFFLLWLLMGFSATPATSFLPAEEVAWGYRSILFILALLIASPVLAFFWFVIFSMTRLSVGMIWEGAADRNAGLLFFGFWIMIGVVMTLAEALFNRV